ncbi:alcohol dehydrogenase catalytic domain-containing protein [Actinomadura sp. LD22]|uniref:Alcohol dehydrogenase catalytic domain-containing protein n=2 Tax=Actinomadura physcomitrii TaxID=2650748 RepID=A0A6I4MQY2_9ACTN|nr:alcohol dehydrogenase catalytic domain-containing protein [Actinomadura physcomitrii]MWA04676.1 alcohol dehydrogenase catalytic domain-containing protein [Actinomadura physcomitrii]
MSRAVVVEAPGRWRIDAGDPPEPGRGEARVRVAAAGLCGSDRELFDGARPEGFAGYPVVPGHEWSGTVEAVGPDTDPSLVGAAVVGEGFRGCMTCGRCREGAPNLCASRYDETGFTRPGAFADHLLVPARLLHVLPPGADLRAAALLEPAAVIAGAVRHAAPRPGETVAVVGAGTLGMLALQFLAASSPARLAAIGPRVVRGEPALDAGATAFGRPGEVPEGAFDVVVETAGAPGTASAAVRLARRGGRVVVTGIPADPADAVPTSLLVTRALSLHTVFGSGPADWTYAVRAFAGGVLRPASLITHELPLTEFAAALKLSGSPDAGKVLLRPDLDTSPTGGRTDGPLL